MSNPDPRPDEVRCASETATGVEVMPWREVPLGGPRAMTVRRTLPQRRRSLIGAWCFVDHYGPDDVAGTAGMQVPGHPHTGLQTVSWLFTGEVEHRDTTGVHALVRPGELNLMTAGSGIAHSEFSTPETTVLHGAQLWVALPAGRRDTDPRFEHYTPPTVDIDGARMLVFLGTLAGQTSPVGMHSPIVGAELTVAAGRSLTLTVDATFEYGILVDTGVLTVDAVEVQRGNSVTPQPVSARWTSWPARMKRRACCCSVVCRSESRSSCGGTSSAAATRRSSPSATTGSANGPTRGRATRVRPGAVASAAFPTRGPRRCQPPCCPTSGCARAADSASRLTRVCGAPSGLCR